MPKHPFKAIGNASRCVLDRIRSRWNPTVFFLSAMSLSAIVYLVYYIIVGDASYTDIFFLRTDDLFMDFFNSVRDASQGEEVYTVRHVIYPPMANLIYLVCSRFLPTAYNNSGWYVRRLWKYYHEAILFFLLFTLIFLLMLFYLVYRKKQGSPNQRFLFALFAVFNVPVLYMLERGNMILLCLVALLVYGFTYHSESRVYRELGLLALAFAFSLKLYPVMFGWFLIVDKRYREAFRCFLYGMAMLILPSFFFGGLGSFGQIFQNIFSFSAGGGTNVLTVISNYGHLPLRLVTVLAYAWVLICALCFALAPFVHRKKRWKAWSMGVLLISVVPSLTSLYSWTFFLVPMVALLNAKKHTAKDWFYLVNMTIPFLFVILRFNSYLSTNTILVYVFTAILSVTLVVDTAVVTVRAWRAKKQGELPSEQISEA